MWKWSVGVAAFVVAGFAEAQVTQIVSVATNGARAHGTSLACAISADGRFVAFSSVARDLVPGDSNGVLDVFVHDRQTGTTERVSVDSSGAQADGFSDHPSISADGRFVAFESFATNLVPADTNAAWDVFVRDRQNGTTERVSLDSAGAEGNGHSRYASISSDGRHVAFESFATNLVASDTNNSMDVFVRDRVLATTERVSLGANNAQGNGQSVAPSISGTGRYVAFASEAANLVAGDTNTTWDVFVRDRQSGVTDRVSVASDGTQGHQDFAFNQICAISADGRFVAFDSTAAILVAGDTNGSSDVFVHDRSNGVTERVSVGPGGVQGQGPSGLPSISADGRYVAFDSSAPNLVSGDSNSQDDVFVRDRRQGTTERVNVSSGGAQANGESLGPAPISSDGRLVAFNSYASNLVAGDLNHVFDIFTHDRAATGFTSLCTPGFDGVVPCPCSNPASGFGMGCDNSAATGGARLSASGISYLSMDSLVFTTSGEGPTAFSIVMQGDAFIAHGLVYGQGVRCAGGATKRLYTKTASAGSITAPDLGAGEPTVSARSAALGDAIQPGQSRWYLVFYRDPVVLGGCSAASTFNSTQTGQVSWSP